MAELVKAVRAKEVVTGSRSEVLVQDDKKVTHGRGEG